MAKEMLQLTLDKVQEKENEAYEHAMTAHAKQQLAVDQEHVLEEEVHQAHQDVEDARAHIKSYDHRYLSNLDEWEMHRQVSNLDIAHRVEDYAEERLAEARAVEEEAVHQEEEADEQLLDLMAKEDELQALLDELKHSAEKSGVTDDRDSIETK